MKLLKKLKNKLIKRFYKPQIFSDKINRGSPIKIHFVGIGGVSMSSLAIYAKKMGYEVSGSDLAENQTISNLRLQNITIYNTHSADNIIGKNVVIYSNATEDSEEVKAAQSFGIKTLTRAAALSNLLKNYNTSICISGAHGKTTTTALIYAVLKEAQKAPALHLGGNYKQTGVNYDFSTSEYIACEACEYKDSFLNFNPNIGVILNIAPEHLDYFKNFENVKNSFQKFANQSQVVIANSECKLQGNNIITFGIKRGKYTAKKVKMKNNGKYYFSCYKNEKLFANIELNLVGKHNVLNALACIAVCDYLNIEKDHICTALKNFCGVERRFEYLHKEKFIIHDYAHHPDEISSVLKETKKFYKNKLLVVFQPHTYSRTKNLMLQFIKSFKKIKEVLILKTYSAREKYDKKGSALLLSKNLGKKAVYFQSNNKAEKYILQKIKQGYGILFLGAGDIYDMAKNVSKMC